GAVEFALPTDAAAQTRIDELLLGAGLKPRDRLVVLNPGAGRPDKRWPIESFRTLAQRLTDEAGASILVIWGPNELADARAIVGTETPGPAVLAPPTNLDELLAVLRRASVMVAADTGPLHLAAALGTRCVGLYGPTAAERNGPYGRGHRALQSPDRMMASLGIDRVFRAVVELLDGPTQDPSGSKDMQWAAGAWRGCWSPGTRRSACAPAWRAWHGRTRWSSSTPSPTTRPCRSRESSRTA